MVAAGRERYISRHAWRDRTTRGGRLIVALVLISSLFALAAAFLGEHVFGLEPCILCLYERVPYALAALL
ncbi:MAG: disulfide bond formation protein B, partial [Rhodospirillales bacterium]